MAWLYIQYNRLLYSEIMKIVQTHQETEDILQDVIEKLIDRVTFLRELDRRGLVNYIITAAKHTAYNSCRSQRKDEWFCDDVDSLQDSASTLDEQVILGENLFCLSQVWSSLDEKTKYLLRAKYVLNMSGKEIAMELGISADNVRMALVRAKRKARQAMAGWSDRNKANQAMGSQKETE